MSVVYEGNISDGYSAKVQYLDVIQKASGDTYVNYESNWDGNYSIVYLDTSVKDIENELVVNNEYEKQSKEE